MAKPTYRSISTSSGAATSSTYNFQVNIPSDVQPGDALYLTIAWNFSNVRYIAATPFGSGSWQYVGGADNATGSSTAAQALSVYTTVASAGMAGQAVYFGFNVATGNGAYAATISAYPGASHTPAVVTPSTWGTLFTAAGAQATLGLNSGPANSERLAHIAFVCTAGSTGSASAPTPAPQNSSPADYAAPVGGTNYSLGVAISHGNTGMPEYYTMLGKSSRGGAGVIIDIPNAPAPIVKSGQGQLITTATAKIRRGAKGLTATRKATLAPATAYARALKGTMRIPVGRGIITATALIAARNGTALQTGFGRASLITSATLTALGGIEGGTGTARLTATAALAALAGEADYYSGTGQGQLTATAVIGDATGTTERTGETSLTATAYATALAGTTHVIPLSVAGWGQLLFAADVAAEPGTSSRTGHAALSVSTELDNVSWGYDPDDHNKFYGQAGDLAAVVLIENVSGQKSITYDVDLDPLSSTAAFSQKGATVQGGQGLLPVGTVLAQNQEGKYVVVSYEDTDSNAVILRTAIDASNEDVLATVIISGTVRLDLLSTEDIEKLDPLGAKVSSGKGTARI